MSDNFENRNEGRGYSETGDYSANYELAMGAGLDVQWALFEELRGKGLEKEEVDFYYQFFLKNSSCESHHEGEGEVMRMVDFFEPKILAGLRKLSAERIRKQITELKIRHEIFDLREKFLRPVEKFRDKILALPTTRKTIRQDSLICKLLEEKRAVILEINDRKILRRMIRTERADWVAEVMNKVENSEGEK